jgi:hypothetical protein
MHAYRSFRAPASGLLYVSELIEEHSRLAKIIGQRGTYVRELFSCKDNYLTWREGNNSIAHPPLHFRLSPLITNTLLYSLPHRLPAKLLQHVATYLTLVLVICCIMCSCNLGPLYLVFLLLAHHPGGKAYIASVSESNPTFRTWIL